MKFPILLILLVSFIYGCGNTSVQDPTDLEGMRQLLKEKHAEQKVLEASIEKLREDILKLNPPEENAPVPVTTIKLNKLPFERYIQVQANAISDDLVNASSELGGRIMKLHVRENDYVRRGQTIATMDIETLDKQIDEVEKSLELANTVFERQKRLWDQNIGSEIQFLEAKNNKERIEKSLETFAAQRKKSTVYAPISGVVQMEFLKQGELASPGMPIVQILNTSKIKFVADVPENYLSKINRGDEIKLSIPALNLEMKKKVSQIGSTIDPSNRTFKVEVDVDNAKGSLKPNLLGEFSFVDFKVDEVISVPVNLIQEAVNGTKYLFISEKSDTVFRAKKIPVKTSESNSERIIITEGLNGDESIINDGSRTVTDGNKIVITATQMQTDEK